MGQGLGDGRGCPFPFAGPHRRTLSLLGWVGWRGADSLLGPVVNDRRPVARSPARRTIAKKSEGRGAIETPPSKKKPSSCRGRRASNPRQPKWDIHLCPILG